ncbi:MAG: thermosome subunit alpha [Methanosphaera sp.]|uniref:thermosome subunit alpha n=1 Tax=Methanosphaera sp. TaxID=2666342 RepID=UPI0025F86C7D|nr:thermosome subunit alpha [Methanosphaera sp.]MCI5867627.1 thermosome subunit [Methanosphaera sp.]MDD6534095.1 thermosome subunit alpha [Methanosphaera sp.]MDY3956096.1 thermosome subunit alpha [Methanosphaera sp.]
MANNNQQPLVILADGSSRTIGSQATRNNIMAAKLLSNVLKTTLGPRGMDKMLVNSIGDVTITNDGYTILKETEPDHPAAQMIINLAKRQEEEHGDGTTTAVVLVGELLKQAEVLFEEGLDTPVIAKGFEKAADKALEVLDDISMEASKENLIKVAKTSMSGKGSFSNLDEMAEQLVNALLDVEEKGKIDADMIKIRKIHGAAAETTEISECVTVDKNVVESEMPKDVKNAKIALLQYPLDSKELETDAKITITSPGEYQDYLSKETELLAEEIQTIVDSGANVLFNNKKISDKGQNLLAEAGILTAKRVKAGDLERLAKATGANIVNNVKELTSDDIGEAEHVYERVVYEDREYIFIEGCKYPGVLNIIVRGSTKYVTDQLEQAFNDAIGAVTKAMASDKVLPGGGAADIAVAKELKQYANTFEDKEQVAIVAFAKALEELALSLAANTGLNTIDILTDLLAAQQDSPNMGINVMTREVSDMLEDGVLESETTKAAIVDGAASIAVEILRIDDVVAARAETPVGGDMPGTPNPWM